MFPKGIRIFNYTQTQTETQSPTKRHTDIRKDMYTHILFKRPNVKESHSHRGFKQMSGL